MIYLSGGKIMGMVIKNMNDANEENDNGFFSLLHQAINPCVVSVEEPQRPPNQNDFSQKQEDGE